MSCDLGMRCIRQSYTHQLLAKISNNVFFVGKYSIHLLLYHVLINAVSNWKFWFHAYLGHFWQLPIKILLCSSSITFVISNGQSDKRLVALLEVVMLKMVWFDDIVVFTKLLERVQCKNNKSFDFPLEISFMHH